MLTSLYLGVKANQYFVCSRCIFLDTKNMFKIWLNPVLSPGRGGGGGGVIPYMAYKEMCHWTGYGFRPLCP